MLLLMNQASGLLQIDQKLEKWPWRHNLLIWHYRQFFDTILFFLSILVTGPSSMSISSLVLKLWHLSFIRGWPEIWRLKIPPSLFYPIYGDQSKLGLPNLARMFLIKCYWKLQNARVTAFTVSELLRAVKLPSSPD